MKMRTTNFFLGVSMVALMTVFPGCASKTVEPKGFLSDYFFIEQAGPEQLLYIDRPASEYNGQYKKVMFEELTVYLHPLAQAGGIKPEQLNKFSEEFDRQIIDALNNKYKVVDKPSRGVLHVHVAIVGIVPNRPHLYMMSENPSYYSLEQASLEVEVFDTETRRRILAIVDRRPNLIDHKVRGWERSGNNDKVLKRWVQLIKQEINQL